MNKKEAIEKIKKLEGLTILDKTINLDSEMILKKRVLNIVNQLDEPEKPVVPQFVADWLEKNDWRKDTSGNQTIFDVFDNLTLDASNGYYADVKKWVEENDNIFAKAWLFGYEVEKEKLYTAKLKSTGEYLHYDTHTCNVHHLFQYDDMAKKSRHYHFTEDKLRKYNAWENEVYEVDEVKEKRYTVEIPNPNRPDIATFLYKENGKVFIGNDFFWDEVPNYKWKNEPENQLTESEIKQDFDWAWQFAEEVKE